MKSRLDHLRIAIQGLAFTCLTLRCCRPTLLDESTAKQESRIGTSWIGSIKKQWKTTRQPYPLLAISQTRSWTSTLLAAFHCPTCRPHRQSRSTPFHDQHRIHGRHRHHKHYKHLTDMAMQMLHSFKVCSALPFCPLDTITCQFAVHGMLGVDG